MDLKLFLLVGLCCVLRASAQDRDKAMQAKATGQLRRLNPRFGRNFIMPPPLTDNELGNVDDQHIMNELPNTIPGFAGDDLEPGMADTRWHLPLENQLFKYFNRQRRY